MKNMTFQILREKIKLRHQVSAFSLVFLPHMVGSNDSEYFIPITSKMKSRMTTEVYGIHVIDGIENTERLIKNQNKERVDLAIAFDSNSSWLIDNIITFKRSYSLYRYPTVLHIIRGKDSILSSGDLWSVPDNSGMRWFSLDRIGHDFDTESNSKLQRILKKYDQIFLSYYNQFIQKITNSDKELRIFLSNIDGYDDQRVSGNDLKNTSSRNLLKRIQEYITAYIRGAEKIFFMMTREIDGIKKYIKGNSLQPESTDMFTEAVVHNYEIVKSIVFLQDTHDPYSSDLEDVRKAKIDGNKVLNILKSSGSDVVVSNLVYNEFDNSVYIDDSILDVERAIQEVSRYNSNIYYN